MSFSREKLLILIILALSCLLILISRVWATEYTITNVTDNSWEDGFPRIHNGQVVWESYDGNDYEIFFYDGSQTERITSNSYNDCYPDIHNGQIVWEGYDGHDYEIFIYDGAQIRNLSNNDYHDRSPRIHNGQVVWESYDGNDYEIFFYDGIQTKKFTSNDNDDGSPDIHNGQIVWQGWDGSDCEIFYYDGIQITNLTDNNYDDELPQIDNGQIVWNRFDGDDYEIYLYDGIQIRRITTNSYEDWFPEIHNGQIVWERLGENDSEIYLYDGIQIIRITHNTRYDGLPHIHNGQIVWQGWDGSDYEIFLATPSVEPSLEILDGVDFTAGREVSSEPEKLASGGTLVKGAVTDGVTRLLLRLSVDKYQFITFSLQGTDSAKEDGILRSIDGFQQSSSIAVNTVDINGKQYAFAIYQAPENFVRDSYQEEDKKVTKRTLPIKVEFSSGSSIEEEIELVRPPLILVHGLWSGPGMWWENGFAFALASEWPGIWIFRVDYESTNDEEFEVNKYKVRDIIENVREQYRSEEYDPKRIAMVQTDILGHSMGGLLARIWAGEGEGNYIRDNNFGEGDINKLITLDSPHYGSFLADAAIGCLLYPHTGWQLIYKGKLIMELEEKGYSITDGALFDLMNTSYSLKRINKIPITPACHAIIGDYHVGSLNDIPKKYGKIHTHLRRLGFDTTPNVVNSPSDLVVSFDSQSGGLILPYKISIRGHHHMDTTTESVAKRVIELLNEKTDSSSFNTGFPVKE